MARDNNCRNCLEEGHFARGLSDLRRRRFSFSRPRPHSVLALRPRPHPRTDCTKPRVQRERAAAPAAAREAGPAEFCFKCGFDRCALASRQRACSPIRQPHRGTLHRGARAVCAL